MKTINQPLQIILGAADSITTKFSPDVKRHIEARNKKKDIDRYIFWV